MMRTLIEGSLRLRYLVLAVALGLCFMGSTRLTDVPMDVFPEFAPPLIEIQTEAPGLTAEEVEALVTVPLENALSGAAFLSTIRSKSVPGLSSVVLLYERGTDLLRARQLVQERLTLAASALPGVAAAPVMLSPLSATSRVMKIGMSSDQMSLVDLSTLARWTVRPRLMAVPGVANVAIWGQRDRQLQVKVDPVRLRAHGVSLAQLRSAATAATRPVAGGFIDTANQRLGLRQEPPVRSAEELAQVPLTRVGPAAASAALTLGEVATVTEGHQPMIGDGIINDGPGILLIVEKQPWGNTLQVTKAVEAALLELEPGLAGVAVDPTIFRPATFIEQSIGNLQHALLLGCVLVILILVLFLYDLRTAIISVVAIPLSLVVAGLVLYLRGATINTMVLAGLIIALGEVVDDAIIDVENIARRLREARAAGTPFSPLELIVSASLEVRSAIVYATLIVVVALVPVFFMEGLSGAFFRPLAISYALAVLSSMLVAMTVTPVLAYLLLTRRSDAPTEEAPVVRGLHRSYGRMLPAVLKHPGATALVIAVVSIAGVALTPFLKESFLPAFKERDFLMHWVEKPGTSLDAMNRITIAASKELRQIPGVRNFGAHVGRAEVADEVVGINFTELWISLEPEAPYMATVAKVQDVVNGYPGLYRDLLTYLKERIKEVLSGSSSSLVVRIYGPELATLRERAQAVGDALSEVPGVTDLKVEPQVLLPQIQVKVDLSNARALGVAPGDIRQAVNTLISGEAVGEVYEAQKIFRVVLWSEEHVRDSVEAVRELLIDTPSGGQVRLSDVADVAMVSGPNVIHREDVSRRIDVGCNVSGRALGDVAEDVKTALAGVTFPPGYHPQVLGEYAERKAVQSRLQSHIWIAVIGVLLLLQASFDSMRLALLSFLTLPAALVGGVLAVAITGGVVSLGSIVGFITVLGIAARNGIMLISHYQHLEHEEGVPFGSELVVRGARERLAPILMTALTTGLALVPLALTGDLPGHEIEHPMAVVILGGIVTSTLLNLLVLPALYLRFGRVLSEHDALAKANA